jgi:hypothetical protein
VTTLHYQKVAAGAGDDGDGDSGDGPDGEGMKTVRVMQGETCVWAVTVAYIHDHTDDGDDEPLSLLRSDHQ